MSVGANVVDFAAQASCLGSAQRTFGGTRSYIAASMEDFTSLLTDQREHFGIDVMEVCRAVARVTYLAVRRHLATSQCFDIRVGVGLNLAAHQRAVWAHLDIAKPLVALMAHTCSPFGPPRPDGAWLTAYEQTARHGRFCGHIAKRRVLNGRYFIAELPFPSNLWLGTTWPELFCMVGVLSFFFDQCRTGLRA